MKTKKTVFRKVIRFSVIALFMVIAQSCETEIHFEDTTPPEFSFQITGDGFRHVFDQDSDFSNIRLNLKQGTAYQFILSTADEGGVANTSWGIKNNFQTPVDFPTPSSWTSWYDHNGQGYRIISWSGDRNNPLTGNILSGSFETTTDNVSTYFNFTASDFGGQFGDPNIVSKRLTINISELPTRIVRR